MSDRLSGLSTVPNCSRTWSRQINQPIKTWFDVDRLNRGGRPTKNPARDLPSLSTRGGRPSRHRQKTYSNGQWPLRSALRGRRRRLRIWRPGDRAGGGKSDKGAVQATAEGLQKDSQTACNSDPNRLSQIMIAMLIDLLPVSFDKFAAVSGTLLDRDSAIVRTWQSATRPQPTSARDRLSPPGSARSANRPQARSRRPRWRRICRPTAIRSP